MWPSHGLVVARFAPEHQPSCLPEGMLPRHLILVSLEPFCSDFRKSCPLGSSLSHCGRPNLKAFDVKAYTVTKPSDRANCQWVAGGCVSKAQGWGEWPFGWSLTLCFINSKF